MIYYRSFEPSVASQFLSYDINDELDWLCTTTDTAQFPSASSSSSSLSTTPLQEQFSPAPWGVEFTDYDVGTLVSLDVSHSTKERSWPWGNFVWKPSVPTEYLDPYEYMIEDQLKEIIREELTESMAQEAIEAGNRKATPKKKPTKEKRREEKGKERERVQPYILAFGDQQVRGRTIYNP
jgi:hypothetical protein